MPVLSKGHPISGDGRRDLADAQAALLKACVRELAWAFARAAAGIEVDLREERLTRFRKTVEASRLRDRLGKR